jgi:hypothetical protein
MEDQSAPIPEKRTSKLGRIERKNKRAWKEHLYRPMRTIKGSLGHSLKRE